MKVCSICKQEKPLEEFYRHSSTKDGRTSYCSCCGRKLKREEYERNRKVPDGIKIGKDGIKTIKNGWSTRIYWDGNMLSIMKRYFPKTLNEEILELLGGQVSMRTMLRKAREMGLQKDPDWLKGVWEERRLIAHVESKKKGYPGAFKMGKTFSGNQYVDANGNRR